MDLAHLLPDRRMTPARAAGPLGVTHAPLVDSAAAVAWLAVRHQNLPSERCPRGTVPKMWEEFWDWTTGVAFDGLAGALVGGGIAAWALRRTIRHERSLRADEKAEEEFSELRQAVGDLYGRLLEVAVMHGDVPVTSSATMRGKLAITIGLAATPDFELCRDLMKFRDAMPWWGQRAETISDEARNISIEMSARLERWLEHPGSYGWSVERADWPPLRPEPPEEPSERPGWSKGD